MSIRLRFLCLLLGLFACFCTGRDAFANVVPNQAFYKADGSSALVPLASNPPPDRPGPATPDYFYTQPRKITRFSDQTRFVTVYIASADYIPGWNPVDTQIVKDAFAEWQHAMDNRLMFIFVTDTAQADVVVNWWTQTQPNVSGDACGQNRIATWGKFISSNDIFISVLQEDGNPWPPTALYTTALHEIGHMMGIQGHSDSAQDVMWPSGSQNVKQLSTRDIATMQRIYATHADFTNPPGFHLGQFDQFKKTQTGKRIWIPIIL